MEIQYKKVKIKVPESLDELTFKQYLEYNKVATKVKEDDDSVENILNTYKIIEILTGATEEELDDLMLDEIKDLSDKIAPILRQTSFDKEPENHIIIDGVDYVAKNPKDLDNGEYISLNILKEQYGTSIDLFPKLLAILIRPGKKEFDAERNEEIWTIEKFNRRDIENLNLRAEKFLHKAKAKDLVPVLNFFLTTNIK